MTGAHLLSAADARLRALPRGVSDLAALESIDVHNNAIAALPDTLGSLQSLRYLDVSGNRLRALPASLSVAAALTDVRASDNRIRSPFCSVAVLDPTAGHTMDVLSPFIPACPLSFRLTLPRSVLSTSRCCHPGRVWPSSPA